MLWGNPDFQVLLSSGISATKIENSCEEFHHQLVLSDLRNTHAASSSSYVHTRCRHLHWRWDVERSVDCSLLFLFFFLLYLSSTELGCAPASVPARLRTRSRWEHCWTSTWSSRRATGEERSSGASVQVFCPPASMVLRAAAETGLCSAPTC